MKPKMSKAEAKAFKKRWKLVNDFEMEELRRTSLPLKFRQLAALMASVDAMGWREALAAEEEEVQQRWQQLRKAYGGSKPGKKKKPKK